MCNSNKYIACQSHNQTTDRARGKRHCNNKCKWHPKTIQANNKGQWGGNYFLYRFRELWRIEKLQQEDDDIYTVPPVISGPTQNLDSARAPTLKPSLSHRRVLQIVETCEIADASDIKQSVGWTWLDKAPRLSISIVIWIFSSDTETSAATPLGGGARKVLAK